jgi:capsular exopolysaccharide synthesis family protein
LDLRDYVRILRRNVLLIVGATLMGVLVGGAASLVIKPTFTSETQLFVGIPSSSTVTDLQQGNTFSQARVQSYVKTVPTRVVLQPAIDDLELNTTPRELSKRVSATTDPETVLIKISVVDVSAEQAAATAQAIANSLIRAVDNLETPKTGGSSPVSLSIVEPAEAPSEPTSPNTRLNLVLGFVIGLTMGLGAAVLRSAFDSRIGSEADVRHVTHAPLLGGIAFDHDAVRRPLLTQAAATSQRAETFRQLRTNLQFANVSGRAQTILVTSSLPGEGKSTTAMNLAISLAQAGQSVCLVDADLRRPAIAQYLGLDRNVGLTTALVGEIDVEDVLQHWGDDRLSVLASGQVPPNPSELLGSDEMKALITRLESIFDSVIIDAPPLLPVTDAAVLSRHVGGVVAVIGANKLKQQDLRKSLEALKMVNATLLGIVLNLLPLTGPDAYAYSYYRDEESASVPDEPSHPEQGRLPVVNAKLN